MINFLDSILERISENFGGNIMKIMPNRMDRGFFKYQNEFEQKALEVLRSGWYILGKEVSSFPKIYHPDLSTSNA